MPPNETDYSKLHTLVFHLSIASNESRSTVENASTQICAPDKIRDKKYVNNSNKILNNSVHTSRMNGSPSYTSTKTFFAAVLVNKCTLTLNYSFTIVITYSFSYHPIVRFCLFCF